MKKRRKPEKLLLVKKRDEVVIDDRTYRFGPSSTTLFNDWLRELKELSPQEMALTINVWCVTTSHYEDVTFKTLLAAWKKTMSFWRRLRLARQTGVWR